MRKFVVAGGALVACLALAGVVETRRVDHLLERLRRVEEKPSADPRAVASVAREVHEVQGRLQAAARELRRLITESEHNAALNERVVRLSGELQEAACALEEQQLRLERFEALEPEISPEAIGKRLEDLRRGNEEEWKRLDATAETAIDLARTTNESLGAIEKDLQRDPDTMWRDLLGPTIQVMGEETVGSGVLLKPARGANGRDVTHAMTAWHVVRDIPDLADGSDAPISVTVYEKDGSPRAEIAHLVDHDATLDIAILVLDLAAPIDGGARLAPSSRLSHVSTFDQIYAVGCPLGNDPIPTFGEIADTHHQVDGQGYWMISAPTYIGNSGGGVFDARTHELLGIFTKIYTHGAVRPTVIPHMGLVTPLSKISAWLERENLAYLGAQADGPNAQPAAASR